MNLPHHQDVMPINTSSISGPVDVKAISQLGYDAINGSVMSPGMTDRTKKSLAAKLLTEAEVYCNRLVDKWFRYVDKNRDDVKGYGELLLELDNAWRNYIRKRIDKYNYPVCGPIFIQKMNFLIGSKAELQAEFEKIKNSENNFGNSEETNIPLT